MAKGSLPRYVVNIPELIDALFPLDVGNTFIPDKQKQRCKGFHLDTVGDKTHSIKWEVPKTIAITGIKIACSRDSEWMGDSFVIYVKYGKNESELFTNVYIKDFIEYKSFACFLKVTQGSELYIDYKNNNGIQKDIWFDIDYISE